VNLYKSVLHTLKLLPEDYLPQVQTFLNDLLTQLNQRSASKSEIMAYAGSWNDMAEEDFEEYRTIAKESGESLFGRDIEL